MQILGIETSCDETSVALVEDGRFVRANLIASQTQLHAEFGGVVPELASRAHIQKLIPMIDECFFQTGIGWDDVDALAVTQGPGLVGALLIGVETAKALAFARRKPLIPVHHIAGHLYSVMLVDPERPVTILDAAGNETPTTDEPLTYPYIGLVVSGGHSSLVLVETPSRFKLLGETVDDAAGEAFDKVAKLLDLGYPGGPIIDGLAAKGDRARFKFPRPMLNRENFDFSFSGLKTAALKLVQETTLARLKEDEKLLCDFCASFQEAIVEVLLRKAAAALDFYELRSLAIVGGVACNGRLRRAVPEYVPGARVVFPPPILCTDNAAMIAGLAFHRAAGHDACTLTLNAEANLPLVAE